MIYTHQDIFRNVIGRPLPYDCGIACLKATYEIVSRHPLMPDSVSYYAFTLVLKGEVEITLDHARVKLGPASLFISPPGINYSIEYISKDYEASVLLAEESFTLGITDVKKVIRAAYFPMMLKKSGMTSLAPDEVLTLYQRIMEIGKYYDMERHIYRNEALKMLYGLFIMDILNIQKDLWIDRQSFSEHMENMFVEFIRLLHLNYRSCHEITFYAQEMAVTPIYLSRVIKRLSGRTVMDFINQMLQLDACNLLANTDDPIARIAECLNFATPASFSKFFSRETGMSPREYRNRYHRGRAVSTNE